MEENSQVKSHPYDMSDPQNWKDADNEGPFICNNCRIDPVSKEGDICEFCQEAAHEDHKCFPKCFICEQERLKAEGLE